MWYHKILLKHEISLCIYVEEDIKYRNDMSYDKAKIISVSKKEICH